jgi:hypothetical protein
MVCYATFKSMSVISWLSILLMAETGVAIENHRQTLSNNVVSSSSRHERTHI